MPPEDQWRTYFDPPRVLKALGLTDNMQTVVDLCCGYGTFAVPAAQMINGVVHAFDIDANMVRATQDAARTAGCSNVSVVRRDVTTAGTNLNDNSVDYAMLFNILHAEVPDALLRECHRILRPQGRLAIMHWNPDPDTPRGPSMDIRPTPEDCVRLASKHGFQIVSNHVDLPPYHFGVSAKKW